MSELYTGQKVVCVADLVLREAAEVEAGVVLPKRNNIYTVREIRRTMTYTGNFVGIRLQEIRNPVLQYLGGADEAEIVFCVTAFRPIVTRRTDISVFNRLLAPANVMEDA